MESADLESPPPETAKSGKSASWLFRLAERSVQIAAIVLLVVFAVCFMRRPERSEWHWVYVRAALRMHSGEMIHVAEPVGYAYPPAMAMLTIPLASLPPAAAMFGWYLVNVAATTVLFVAAWRLIGGTSLARLSGRWQAVFWIGTLLSLRFVITPLKHQQFDMVIAALLLAGCWCVWRGWDLRGAVLLGCSAAMKCTPLLFAPYLCWRGKFLAAGVLVAVAVGLNLLPDLFWPQEGGGLYITDWTGTYLGLVAREAPGTWFSDLLQNQSLSGLFGRFMRFGFPLHLADLTPRTLSPAAELWLRAMVYGTGLVLLAASAWRFGKPLEPAPTVCCSSGEPISLERLQTGLEAAAVVCLMLLLSPMTSKAHYVVLLLPSLFVARAVVCRPGSPLCWLVVPLAVFGPLTTKGLIGKSAGMLTLAWGLPTLYVLVCLVGIWLILPRTRTDTLAGAAAPERASVAEGLR